ncbi:PQQ-dependent sugar dehydrogenase [Nocardia carnea]|uniref:PQQ-dependent sugar dehydrogenase n=1 Tax=Nocardia carnea TaxID=37328 RepID=UPI0024551CAE|nr:PQQ-dependent sugar dehydrogenase [Nocardia carnea]
MTGRRRVTGRRFTGLAGAILVAGVVAACTPGPGTDPTEPTSADAPAASPSSPDGTVTTVTTDLAAPWSVAFHGDTALVSERDSARILELDADGNPREVGVIAGAAPAGEGGLLGIAVRDSSLYAYYTAGDENRLERFELTGVPGGLGLGSGETLLAGIPAARFHNGGRIAFGPDGMLYATVGDAGDRGSAQDRNAPTGKILRMTPDGRAPEDNPFPGSPVYSYGHRNPQGLAWSADGTLYASEFGQDTWDELNVIEPGGNYGWPEVEGIAGRAEFIDPVQQWRPADASPSGMAIRNGVVYLANLRGERLRQIPLDDLATSTEHLVGAYGRLRDVTLTPRGSLWVLTNNTDGRGNPAPGDDRILQVEPGN